MTLAADLAATLPELQAQAESTMITRCRISRSGGVTADPDTGADVLVMGDLVYDGTSGDPGCKIQNRANQVLTAESGSGTVTVQDLQVHVPSGSGPYRVGDLVEILSADLAVVRLLRVEGTPTKTWQTAERLPVVELHGGAA